VLFLAQFGRLVRHTAQLCHVVFVAVVVVARVFILIVASRLIGLDSIVTGFFVLVVFVSQIVLSHSANPVQIPQEGQHLKHFNVVVQQFC
jgi:dolichyl-phosphate-mannose--protein O-mannosyl transferase